MTVKLQIDNQTIEVDKGRTILEAARKLNIDIPTLCYHKALSPYGACRLCVVEINKAGRKLIQTSCQYPAEEGIVVTTQTPQLQNMRRTMIELILAEAPNAPKVKEMAERLGVRETRFKRKDGDCILCGMCVRMCKERMGRSAIGFSKRGDKRKIAPPFDVNSKTCMVCGACYAVCPTANERLKKISDKPPRSILDEFDERLRPRPAIRIPFPQAVPNLAIIDKEKCIHFLTDKCKVCEEFCEAKAIIYDQKEQVMDLNVGSIVLAAGFDEFDAKRKSEYGYGRFGNVVTSMEFERILSASGPFQGHIKRPGDLKEPKKIAFIQCVGSRDPQAGASYCSSVCCTYAIKESIIAKEHSPGGLDTTIFYMDIRTFGKGFESYYVRSKKDYGVRFVRAGISKIDEDPVTKNLIIHYESEAGEIQEEEFDMVVLSVGLVPKEGMMGLSKKLRVNLNEHGFCRTSEFLPVDTIRDGIYVCGVSAGPKDIPETVTQASAAAGEAMTILAGVRNTLVSKKQYAQELDTSAQEPRIGAFICHCGINIGGYVDVKAVMEYARTLPGVVYVENNLYTCSQDTQKKMVEMIKEHQLNRVVVASCTPRTHEPLFRETIREAGLNPYLFEMANIRDQCSWIHMQEPVEATAKAKDLVRMAIAKARLLTTLKRVELDVTQKALVIGGGVTGMVSAVNLADQGFDVFLVEREPDPGGHMRHIYRTIEGRNVVGYLDRLTANVKAHKHIKLFTKAEVESLKGFVGSYESRIKKADGGVETVVHGVVIVATGADEHVPAEYQYGSNDRVVTQREFEKLLNDPSALEKKNARNIVMIQCVGSRDDKHEYCSRICCFQAVKNALHMLEQDPQANIYVLYRDIRTYGLREDYYRKAREAGVVFIRYDDTSKPVLESRDGKLRLTINEPILRETIEILPDLVVLSAGIEPRKDNAVLAKMLKVPLNSEGFFLEAHVKLRPVDFATEGVFVAGMAHNPKGIDEAISQAMAAAARATTIIAHKKYYAEATVSFVNEDLCAGCGVCSALCPYEAIEITVKDAKRLSRVNEALCKGCGTCVAACSSGAMGQHGFTRQQIIAMVDALKE